MASYQSAWWKQQPCHVAAFYSDGASFTYTGRATPLPASEAKRLAWDRAVEGIRRYYIHGPATHILHGHRPRGARQTLQARWVPAVNAYLRPLGYRVEALVLPRWVSRDASCHRKDYTSAYYTGYESPLKKESSVVLRISTARPTATPPPRAATVSSAERLRNRNNTGEEDSTTVTSCSSSSSSSSSLVSLPLAEVATPSRGERQRQNSRRRRRNFRSLPREGGQGGRHHRRAWIVREWRAWYNLSDEPPQIAATVERPVVTRPAVTTSRSERSVEHDEDSIAASESSLVSAATMATAASTVASSCCGTTTENAHQKRTQEENKEEQGRDDETTSVLSFISRTEGPVGLPTFATRPVWLPPVHDRGEPRRHGKKKKKKKPKRRQATQKSTKQSKVDGGKSASHKPVAREKRKSVGRPSASHGGRSPSAVNPKKKRQITNKDNDTRDGSIQKPTTARRTRPQGLVCL
jgi:hypothetical protein